jgi:3-oxoadipate enol-lactonase
MTADLNWFSVFPALAAEFRVVAVDLRGHGRGISGRRFSLEDCADDIAALAGALGIRTIVPVGYSMGGLVAQLVWRRHPELVSGLVLCSTARNFRGSPVEKLVSLGLPSFAVAAQMMPFLHLVGSSVLGSAMLGNIRDPGMWRWACAEMELVNLATAFCAVEVVSRFTSHDWIGGVRVPTSVVVTTRDQTVPASRQVKLAQAIPGAVVHPIDDDHGVCLNAPAKFSAVLLTACRSIARLPEFQPRYETDAPPAAS